jgi:carboxypeptidase D
MLWTNLLSALLLTGTAEAAGRSIAHAGKRHAEHAAKRAKPAVVADHTRPVIEREQTGHKFLNDNTTSEYSTTPID